MREWVAAIFLGGRLVEVAGTGRYAGTDRRVAPARRERVAVWSGRICSEAGTDCRASAELSGTGTAEK